MMKPRRSSRPGKGPLGRLRAKLSGGSLTARAMRSSLWLLGGNSAMKVLRLGSNLILVRLLAPEDFGLMALVFTLHTGLEMLTDIGVKPAVVRSPHGDDPLFLRTAWTVQATRFAAIGACLVLVGAALATVAGRVDLGHTIYADPRLSVLIAASSGLIVIEGLISMSVATAERQVRMPRVVALNALAYLISTAVTIVWAWLAPSVWALMGGAAAGVALRCAFSHLLLPGPRMRFALDPVYRAEIWDFGKWLMGSSALGFLGRHGDKLVLAALFDPTAFSFYAIARLWIDAAQQTVNRVSRTVGLAGLSEVKRSRPADLPRAFRKYRMAQGAVCVAMFAFFLVFGDLVIGSLYPEGFAAVGAIMPLLAPILILQSYNALTSVVLMEGNSRAFAGVTMKRAIVTLVGVPIVFHLVGPSWAILLIAVGGAFGVPTLLRLTHQVIPLNMRIEALKLVAIVCLAAAITHVVGWSPS